MYSGADLQSVPLKDLYTYYKQWCTDNGVKAFGCNKFSPFLEKERHIKCNQENKKGMKYYNLSNIK